MQWTGSLSIIIRLEINKRENHFGRIITLVSEAGGDIVAIDVISEGKDSTVRDISVNVKEQAQIDQVLKGIKSLKEVSIIHLSDRTFLVHLGGKIETTPKVPIKNREDLSRVYTPGVAQVCSAIEKDKSLAHSLTIKRNTIAIVSDGSAVLGLGNIGPEAAMPVMEGKAMLFKQLGGVDAFPICLDTQDPDEIVKIIKGISPSFGGINLEDISSPRCFEIEKRLKEELDIPIFHDDQHGTAVVILAGLINAMKVVGKNLTDCKVVICGIGAAGMACTKILQSAGVRYIVGVDRMGALVKGTNYNNENWNWYANHTNPYLEEGSLSDVIVDADVFIGVSAPGMLTIKDIKSMADDPIVFAMANPLPEIRPEDAEPYVKVLATGRSDYPNQINNVLSFPGIFRGTLDARASDITEEMKLAAAHAIANVISEKELDPYYIIPSVFNEKVVESVKIAVQKAAYKSGVAKKSSNKFINNELYQA
ncbi:NAD-dependent malic enzyme [Metabacillus halosaccharovorans]|uniref:NAD-dependent malic enzyme n=1 Tax=Metabacillus halosaccharovorans TaxID=930124 RepID=UPI001C1F704A|nr:NAD-dependent malic enzyme [Metabacillus halosaccharovorans]MBU7595747.1 NAD-dependent malic enzyme [Metabacillus halosaccharovorans]